ncbi:MAG: type II toxin-antitoxin system PemK/MazF family toxin [Clostridia bacterium]
MNNSENNDDLIDCNIYAKVPYSALTNMEEHTKKTMILAFSSILESTKNISSTIVFDIIKDIPDICKMHHDSCENTKIRMRTFNKNHPIRPIRGQIYNAYITTGVGKELKKNHPVVIIQNLKANIFSEKVNVLPIEGDGNIINKIYAEQICSNDVIEGKLDKIPSRVITSDILTIDKARLGRLIGKLSEEKMHLISEKVKKQLEL